MASKLISRFALCVATLGAIFMAACQSGESSKSGGTEPVKFGSDVLPAGSADAGQMLEFPIEGSGKSINNGFMVRFTSGTTEVHVAPFHVENGTAFVMVPPLGYAVAGDVEVALTDLDGKVSDRLPGYMTITAADSTMRYTRASFDAAIGGGLERLINLAVEAVQTLEAEGIFPTADAAVVNAALGQQADIMGSVGFYNLNLDDTQMALLQQMLDNTKILPFLADAAGVSLTGTGSASSPLSVWWRAMIQSALLKADMASFLIGEVRGVLNLLAWVANQLSGLPLIGSAASSVATWATGLSASLAPAHDIINQMIPCDLVRLTAGSSSMNLPQGQTGGVLAYGRFETQEAFNTQLMQQFIGQWVNWAAQQVTTWMTKYPVLSPYTGYVGQVAQLVPMWVTNWLTHNGFLSTSVVPGQNYTVFSIDQWSMDMSVYRFDMAGLVANLLNLPYSAINAFFSWIGIGVGQPIGGYEGVGFTSPGVGSYLPASDSIQGVGTGSTTARIIGLVGQEASGWWNQWGFYALRDTTTSMYLTVS